MAVYSLATKYYNPHPSPLPPPSRALQSKVSDIVVGRWCQIHALSLRIVQSSFINLCGQPGSYCNHYFLRMLAMISRGHYDAVFDAGQLVYYSVI